MKKQILAVVLGFFAILVMIWGCNLGQKCPSMELNRADTVTNEITEVYGTDISVTVDGRPVQAYSFDGRTEIAVEDLEYCGFTVERTEDGITATTFYPENYDAPEISYEKTDFPIGQTEPDGQLVKINNIPIRTDCFNGKHYVYVYEIGALTDDYNKKTGWSDYNFRTEYIDETNIAITCFRFPPINVPSMLEDMTPMVNTPEFELYTEGQNSTEYGAVNEPKNGVLAGINGDGNGDWTRFKKKIFKNDFSVYSNYIEFDLGQLDVYPINKQTIGNKDVLMLVPWNTRDVTLAAQNEEYIRAALDNLKQYHRPVIIRYGAEMNVSDIGNSPTAYIKAFRFVADIVHEYGFAVMWSVNDLSALNKPYNLYYPGDEYVDWIGVSIYPTHDFMHTAPTSETDSILFGCSDYGWHTNNIKYIERYMKENNINKPLAVSEGAVESYLFYDGAPDEFQDWAEARLRNMYWYLPMCCPNLKLITYFSVNAGGSLGGSDLSQNDGYINIIDEALAGGMYKPSFNKDADFAFVEANGYEFEKGDKIPLYSYVYLPKEDTLCVQYVLDGTVIDTKHTIPYKTVLDTYSLQDGLHRLSVNIEGSENYYTMMYEINIGDNAVIKRQ